MVSISVKIRHWMTLKGYYALYQNVPCVMCYLILVSHSIWI